MTSNPRRSGSTFRKRNRTLHRWVGPPFVVAAVISLLFTGLGGDEGSPLFALLGVVLVACLLALVVTGSIMWVQHYRPRRRT